MFGLAARQVLWETEGASGAHGSISALIRLYLAQLPPVEEHVEETQAEEVEPEELTQDDRTQAQTELLDAQAPRAQSGGAWGFGWWREEGRLYYKTPYQAEIARALEATPQATWDKLSTRWELPDTEESVQLLEGLVRAHWGFDLKDVVYLHLDDVGRGWRAPVGELWELSRPRKDTPDGAWGRVIAGQGYLEQSDGWHDGWHAYLWVRRVGEDDEGARAKIQETRDAVAAASRGLAEQAEQAAALKARWSAAGLSPIPSGDELIDGLPAGGSPSPSPGAIRRRAGCLPRTQARWAARWTAATGARCSCVPRSPTRSQRCPTLSAPKSARSHILGELI